MKILFVHPPANVNLKIQKGLKYPPLGIAFVSAVTLEQGHNVRIFDANVERNPFQSLRMLIQAFQPEVVGISFTSLLSDSAHHTARFVKTTRPRVIVIAGGYHPTIQPLDVIKDTNFDAVVVGEGEITFLEWLKAYESKDKDYSSIKGLVFRKNGEIIVNPERELIPTLDTVPFPAYGLLPIRSYSSMVSTRKPYVTFIRSRGCPFNCIFCGVQRMFGKKYRVQSPQKTISEIERLVKEFKIKEVLFKDSDFLIDRNNVIQLCKLLIERKLDLIWSCNSRVDMINEKIALLMKQAGCKMITYGVESGNQEILNNLKKDFTLEQVTKAIQTTKNAGIQVTLNIIFGSPQETKETARETLAFVKQLDPDYLNCAYLTAFPGSCLYNHALCNGWFIDGKPNSFAYEQLRLNATKMSVKELSVLVKNATRSFYLRPAYIAKKLRHLNYAELKNDLKGLWAIIRNY
ncbi:MAG: B12-binding domain-containing radical SAM protein [Candidatus Omnitrophica bacterium]|nr:B12-binding domain-containing radical SAM protein [Candidatus Omnitrophota bacterium]MBU1923115.1 B12-binding domain-containing radical SAM protein [Candidatus Omnitrophota bacterium]